MAQKIIFTEEQLNKIIELHNKGYLNREIAEIFCVSRQTIGRKLKDLGVESRHPFMNQKRESDIVKLYKDGCNKSYIAKKMHTSTSTIKNILDKNNIEQKSMSEVKSIYTLNEKYFDSIDTHQKAYFLGLLYADGSVSKKNNCFQISLQERDRHILDSFNKSIGSNRKLYFNELNKKNKNHSNQYMLSVTNKHMHDSLIKNGVVPNKSLILEFPKFLHNEFYPSFILGYMDGDGTISKNESRCSFISTENFCLYAKCIIEKELNIHCSVMKIKGRNTPTRCLSIAGTRQVKKFLDWIYSESDVYLYRKHNIYVSKYCS